MTMIGGLETPEENYLVFDSMVMDSTDQFVLDARAKIYVGHTPGTAVCFAGMLGVGYRLYSVVEDILAALVDITDDQTRRLLLHEALQEIDDFDKHGETIFCLPDAIYGVTSDLAVVRSNGQLITSGTGGPILAGAYAAGNEEGPAGLREAAKRACWVSVMCAPPVLVWGSKSGFLK